MAEPADDTYRPGLEGIIANETAIANIEGREGQGGLEYRGYAIEELAHHVSFEETAFLLLHGDLPTAGQLADFDQHLRTLRVIPEPLVSVFHQIPGHVHPMDVLRTSASILGHFDPDVNAQPRDHAANVRKAERLLAQLPTAIAYRERIQKGLPVVPPDPSLDHAANFLAMVTGERPSETKRKAFDLSLVLYAEHELNASTFAGRVTVSTYSDLYSGIVAAIGTLKGPLHGGANEEAWKVLEQVGSPENAERWIHDALARGERTGGVRPSCLQDGRPPPAFFRGLRLVAAELGEDRWERIAGPIEEAVTHQKHLPANVDWPSARLYHYLGLRTDIYTPIFAMASVSGWAAHIIEQLDHNRLMRPRSRYIGPPSRVVRPISQR
ncbi:MAG: citrate/2-methylcitrate synthase [Isosphaeraceae bacterium]